MGSTSSKASRAAAGAAKRQYPQRVPPNVRSSAPPSRAPPATSSTPADTSIGNGAPQRASRSLPSEAQFDSQSQGPAVRPSPQASGTRSEAINRDARDPDFDASLRSLGPVQPNTTYSPSSTAFRDPASVSSTSRGSRDDGGQLGPYQAIYPNPATNPALRVLEARSRIAAEAEQEQLAGPDAGGKMVKRKYIDALAIRQILQMRDVQGLGEGEIERRLELADGLVGKLGRKGVVGHTGTR